MRFAVLGPLMIAGEEARDRLTGRKERHVLAMLLASSGGVVAEEVLVEGLWGSAAPPSAARSLQSHVSRVRTAVAPAPVRRAGSGWRLELDEHDLDSAVFESLLARAQEAVGLGSWVEAAGLVERARALWRGPPFDGYEDLEPCAREASRLVSLRELADDLDAECALALGGAADMVPRLRWLTDQSPFRERRWAMLMTALFRAGRQGEALAAYDQVRRTLRTELGVDPSPELQLRHLQVLDHDPGLLAPLRGASGEPPEAPWPGLAPYRPSDAAVFLGRERLVARVLSRLSDPGVVTLAGVSGSGKSSLVLGGLVPALRAGALPGSEAWTIEVASPALASTPTGDVDVLVLDQAEELFTVLDDDARFALAVSLSDAVATGTRLVLAIRADYWPRCAAVPALMELVAETSLLVAAMTPEELRRVVVEPARRYGVEVGEDVVEQVLADVGGRDGCLPLVSTALARSWPPRGGSRLTTADYWAGGGVGDAVGAMAEECYATLMPDEQRAARDVLVRLADDDGSGGNLVRRRVPVDALAAAVPGSERVLRSLAEARLVTLGERGAEVVHESLFTSWPRLADWLQADAAARRLRSHLTPAATDWASRGRRAEDLYRGARLVEALEASTGRALLSPLELEFLDASEKDADAERMEALDRADREARAARRLRVALVGLVVLLLVAGTVAVLAVQARERALEAETEAVAGRLAGTALLEPDAAEALLLARQAVALDEGAASRSALFGVLVRHPRLVGITDVGDRALAVRLGPGGKEAVTCTIHGEIAARRVDDLTSVRVVRAAGGNFCGPLTFLDAGRSVATVRQVETAAALEVRSFRDGALLASVPLADGWYAFAAPDSSAIAVGSTLGGYLVRREGGSWSATPWGADLTVTNIVGRLVATSRPGEAVAVRQLPGGGIVRRVVGTRDQVARALTQDRELAVTVGEREVRLIDLRTGRQRLTIATADPVADVFFAARDTLLVTTTTGGQAQVWRRSTGRIVTTVGAGRGSLSADVTREGDTLVTLAEDGTLATWDLTGERSFGRERHIPTGVVAAARLDDGSVAMGTGSGEVHLLDGDDLRVRATLGAGGRVLDVEPTGPRSFMAVADGRLLSFEAGSELTLVDSESHGGLSDVAWHPESGLALATDEGRSVTFLGDGGVRRVRLTDTTSPAGPVRHEMWGHVAWAPDGDLLAVSTNDGQVHVLDREGRVLAAIPPADEGPTPALGVAFLEDDTLLVGDRRGRVTQWDPRTSEQTRPPTVAASGTAVRLAVVDDLVAVGSTGTGVGLLDAGDHVLYGNDLLPEGAELMVPLLSPDLTLTALDPTGVARQWPGSLAAWTERACQVAGRRLSRSEWVEHLGERPYDPAC